MEDVSTGMRVVTELVRSVELAVCVAVAALLLARWRRHGSPAAGAALALFGVLAAVLASGYWQPDDISRGAGLVWTKAVICVLLALPTLLVLFTQVLGALGRRWRTAALAAYAAQVVVTVAIPPLPEPGDPRPGWVLAYTVAVLAAWTGLSVVAAVGLWRAGRHQSSVVRHRMQSLSSGAVLMSVALIASGAAGGEQGSPAQVAVLLLGLVSVLLFALAFLLPPSLRMVWRQADLAALSEAERGLMTALTPQEVAATIVPVLSSVFGGQAVLLDRDARPYRDERAQLADVQALCAIVAEAPDLGGDVRQLRPGVLAARLSEGWVAVQAGRLSPVFGDDEAVLLGRVAMLVDLALQRVALFTAERQIRLAAEAANAELETLLYSVSHDLRSPLISVLGYLDVLRQEHAAELSGDGSHYVERITVNAVYMQSLISDLLELSRIGRSDPPPQVLDLHGLAEQVVDAARVASPAADVAVLGRLPVARMNDVRARQLLTNLVDNALKHGGRGDLRVTVGARRSDDGGLLVEVADDGRGVPEEYRARVLRVFERLDAPKSSPGTGMGLAICKRIAESLGGALTVGGPPPGAATGTTVRLALPASVLVDDLPVLPQQRSRTDPARAEELT